MNTRRLAAAAPYALAAALAAWFLRDTSGIDTSSAGTRLGPEFWPRLTLGGMVLASLAGLARALLLDPPAVDSDEPDLATAPAGPIRPLLAFAGVTLCVAYALGIGVLGFPLATVLFFAAFILLGGYRDPPVIAAASLAGGLGFFIVFQKVVYVSLPLGEGPFRDLTIALMRILGVR